MTATKTILRHVHYFFDTVLRSAYFDSNWSCGSLDRALQWAEYCEKVYTDTWNKPYAGQLDKYIQEIGSNTRHPVLPALNLSTLKEARRILTLAFLQNPFSTKGFRKVLAACRPKCSNLSQDLSAVAVLKSALQSLAGDPQLAELWKKTQAELLLDHFCYISSANEAKLSELIEKFVSSGDVEMLLRILVHRPTKSPLANKLQSEAVDWLLQKLDPVHPSHSSELSASIWSADPKLLCQVSSLWLPFYRLHIAALIQAGCQLKPAYVEHGHSWVVGNAQPTVMSFDFDSLVHHFCSLLTCSETVSRTTRIVIDNLLLEPGCALWQDLNMVCEDKVSKMVERSL